MGRRSLPKIQGDLDLSRHFYLLEDFAAKERPWNPELLFHRNVPLELEIGSGKGLFIRNAAIQNPSHDFIGIEIAYRYALTSAAQLSKRNINNALMVNGDAARILHEIVPDNSLHAIHVYFPDPWWKKAHKKRRILRKDVVLRIEQTLKTEGKFHFWTDVEEYYLTTLELLKQSTNLCGPFPVQETEASDDMDYRTHFERRTRLHEKPVYRTYFVKSEE